MSEGITNILIGGGITLAVALVFFLLTRSRLMKLEGQVRRRTDELADKSEENFDRLARLLELIGSGVPVHLIRDDETGEITGFRIKDSDLVDAARARGAVKSELHRAEEGEGAEGGAE